MMKIQRNYISTQPLHQISARRRTATLSRRALRTTQSGGLPAQAPSSGTFPPRLTGLRLLSLLVVLAMVTLGLFISLLYLSSLHRMKGTTPEALLLSWLYHLPLSLPDIGNGILSFIHVPSGLLVAVLVIAIFAGVACYIVSALIYPKRSDTYVDARKYL